MYICTHYVHMLKADNSTPESLNTQTISCSKESLKISKLNCECARVSARLKGVVRYLEAPQIFSLAPPAPNV